MMKGKSTVLVIDNMYTRMWPVIKYDDYVIKKPFMFSKYSTNNNDNDDGDDSCDNCNSAITYRIKRILVIMYND